MRKLQLAIGALVIAGFFAIQALFIVDETEYEAIVRFGAIQRIEKSPGLKVKIPLIETVQKFDNRLLRIDVRTESMPDKDQQFWKLTHMLDIKLLIQKDSY